MAPDGSAVFVTGSGAIAVYKAATGATIWTHSITFGPTSVAVSPDGSKIFVAGASGPSTSTFGTTAAYNAATGAKLWSQTSTNPGGYNAIAVSPDGSRVFVTGTWQRMFNTGYLDPSSTGRWHTTPPPEPRPGRTSTAVPSPLRSLR